MTLQAQQLALCKKCLNRKTDLQLGLVCNITGQKADFTGECPNYSNDASVVEVPVDNEESLAAEDIQKKLPDAVFERIIADQNFSAALIAGIVVGLVGAILWGVITVATNYQIGYMALAIGAGVGFAVRMFGKGIDEKFGYLGAVLSFFSVLIGNFLSVIGYLANAEGLGYIETLLLFDYAYFPQLMAETFSLIDVLFYGIAVYEGYKFSFRKITEQDILEMQEKK